MIQDKEMALSDAQALTATAVSTNSVDLGIAGNRVGTGEPLCVFFNVVVAADAGNADETYAFKLVSDDVINLASPTDLTASFAIARGTLVAGYRFAIPLPSMAPLERYLGVSYTLGGTTPSITIDAVVMPLGMIQNAQIFPDGFTIS